MKEFDLIMVFIFAYALVKAGDTNTFYITDNTGYGKFAIAPNVIEAAKTNRESLPAKDFPEGNWGTVNGGYQLSLRLYKQAFTNWEPIVAILLIRNVTNENAFLSYDPYPVGSSDGPIGFQVISDTGYVLPQHRTVFPEVWSSEANYRCLSFDTQAKYIERLDQRFDLTNGAYTVQAVKTALIEPLPKMVTNGFVAGVPFTYPVFDQSRRKAVEVKSAEVKFRIN